MTMLSSPCSKTHTNCSHSSLPSGAAITSSASVGTAKRTSVVISIVTTELVPDVNNSGTTTTIDRELKLRLTLPSSYDTNHLKSLNVRLQQDDATMYATKANPSSCQSSYCGSSYGPENVPPSVPLSPYSKNIEEQQRWQQQQLQFLQGEHKHPVLPASVLSSQDHPFHSDISASDASLHPETVLSSNNGNRNKGKTRRRATATATTTVQLSSRKKRKVTKKSKEPTQ